MAATKTSPVVVRLDKATRERLESMAKARRMATGEPVTLSALIREALEQFTRQA